MELSKPFSRDEDCVRLAVRLTPRAAGTQVTGLAEDGEGRVALTIRLAAPPVDGAANKALLQFLADWLDLPRSALSIKSGETGRRKIIAIKGDAAKVVERLEELIG